MNTRRSPTCPNPPRLTPKLEDQPLSIVQDYLLSYSQLSFLILGDWGETIQPLSFLGVS
jgi:hypothetical protein